MSLTKVSYSMITGAPVNVLDFGADPTGVANSQPAIQAAIDSGAQEIIIPSGEYRLNSQLVVTKNNAVKRISGYDMSTTLKLYTAVQQSCFEIQYVAPPPETKQFFKIENLILKSNGTNTDGLFTYGILAVGCSYAQFNNIRSENFSGAGLELRGSVYVGIANYTAGSCFYGLSFQLNGATQCTATQVDRAYVSGCTRGITQTGAVNMIYNECVMEFSGSTTTIDGALHIAGGTATFNIPYFEANFRNVVSIEGSPIFVLPYGFGTGTAADVFTFAAVPFNERGVTLQYPYNLYLPRINADITSNRNLVIGENLTVPVAGGSVKLGETTTERIVGAVPSGVFTTIYTVSGQSGDGAARKGYRYAVYAGRADLTTGYDTGTILNGTLYSDSGTTPAFLQLSGNNIQLSITNTSYGLDFGLSLLITNGIGAP